VYGDFFILTRVIFSMDLIRVNSCVHVFNMSIDLKFKDIVVTLTRVNILFEFTTCFLLFLLIQIWCAIDALSSV
jgi:hypothetical protein